MGIMQKPVFTKKCFFVKIYNIVDFLYYLYSIYLIITIVLSRKVILHTEVGSLLMMFISLIGLISLLLPKNLIEINTNAFAHCLQLTNVKFNEQLAFASNNYLQTTESSVETNVEHKLKNDIAITTSRLNFRKQPNIDSERILTFEENTELQVLAETDNGWLLVKSNNVLGYVSKEYTISMHEMLNNIYPDLVEDLTLQKVVYATQDLNVRSGNSTETEAIDLLERLESVRVYGEFGDWYLIMTNNHTFGFVHKDYTKELDEEFVIVDLDQQKLYLYNGTDQYIQTPVTTGKDSTPSDKGLFKIYYKSRNTPLIGDDYNVTVDYWMNYNNGEGLHDASWRSVFGTNSYHTNGSHGCINIPPHLADDVYEYTQIGTKVLVHK